MANSNNDLQAIDATLNSFHLAAAHADLNSYFDLLTNDAVFLGTDAKERWTKEAFKAFVQPYFSQGKGWLYQVEKRHVTLNKNGNSAFFDEQLYNQNYGVCRGSGVLYKTDKGWKIAQYNLSVPLPNAIAKDITKQIQKFSKSNNNAK
jgi:ketosteroid isomerase-like protein